MDITPLIPKGRQIITGYGSGQFRINGNAHTGSLLIFSTRVLPWNIAANAAITLSSLMPIMENAGEVEILLIGCGKSQSILPAAIKNKLKDSGVALEVMDTGAACRTFNILMGEGRRVAAAVIPV